MPGKHIEAEQFEMRIQGGEIGEKLAHYSLTQLRAMRDHVEAELSEHEPKLKRLLETLMRCAPKQERAVFAAALIVCPRNSRSKLRALRILASYTASMERAHCPNASAASVPVPEVSLEPLPLFLGVAVAASPAEAVADLFLSTNNNP